MTQRPSVRAAVLAGGLAMAMSVSGCGEGLLGGGGDDEKGDILIGMDIPLSGDSAEIGPYMKNGAQLAVDEINGKGGVLGGRKLKLQAEDDACDPKTAVAAANKLVSAGVKVSVSGYCSGATLPTLPVFDRAKIPMIIPVANSAELAAQRLRHVFMINGTGDQQAAAAFTWLTRQRATKVALMHDNTSYSKDIADRTAAELDKPGAPDKTGVEAVTPKETDFSAAVTRVLKGRPDYIYWTGYYAEGGLLIRQFKQAGYKGRFLVGDGSVADRLAQIAGGTNAEGVYATMTPTPATLQGAEGWKAAYKTKFGADPGPYSTQAYDGIRVAAEAITKADGTDPDKIVTALEQMNGFRLFSGPLKFTPQHTIVGGFEIQVVRNGTFVLAEKL
ncbi:branched-chain amino acid ABC transporter substrate-binding protein [Spirillospora sp. NPDC047279]|uniref:branched-chain amino acid ABC transporter substrate-binding protein n=1 Tax=Spirillospora sp. NPDC047279 TaxID=3155478 RepID=UPI0033C047D9